MNVINTDKNIGLSGLLIHRFPSGLSRYSYEIIKRILFDPHVNSVAYSTSDDLKIEFQESVYNKVPELNLPAGFKSNFTRLSWQQTILRYLFYQHNIQLYYSPIPEGMLFPSVPQVITIHDLLPLNHPDLLPRWVAYYKYYLPLLIKHSVSVVCVSEFTKQEVLSTFPKTDASKLIVIHGGFDTDKFYARTENIIFQQYKLKDYLLCVGEGRPYKNIESILKAIALNKNGPELVVIGKFNETEKNKLVQLSESLKITKKIHWLGYVNDELLPHFYSEALAFIFPSLYEGFGLPIIESMACGCPTLSSDRASLLEIGGNAAHFFNPLDIEDISSSIKKIGEDKEYRSNLHHLGLKRAKLFSWDFSYQKHINLFNEILN